jgi:hypothetical protein
MVKKESIRVPRMLRVESIIFKRSQKSPEEAGLLINEGEGPIIDMLGKVVPAPIWSWNPDHEFTFIYRPQDRRFK